MPHRNRASAGSELDYAPPQQSRDARRGRANGRAAVIVACALLLWGAACQPASAQAGAQSDLGRRVYAANCAVCHGPAGEGQPEWKRQGPDKRFPAPPHGTSGHTWHHGDGVLFSIVKHGGTQFETANFVSGMPAFADKLTDEEIRAVIVFLSTFWGDKERQSQAKASVADPFPLR